MAIFVILFFCLLLDDQAKTIGRIMSHYAFLIPLLLSTFFSNAVAANALKILSENENELTLEFTLPPFNIETLHTNGQSCQRIYLPDLTKTLQQGYPELPVKALLMQVPQDGEITTQLVETQAEILENVDLCPVPKPLVLDNGEKTWQFIRNDGAYQEPDFFPNVLFAFGSRGILRGVSVSRLQVFPLQWNPVTQQLRYFNQIRFQVQFENPLPKPTRTKSANRQPKVADVYETLLQRTIFNYQGQPLSTPSLINNTRSRNVAENSRRQEEPPPRHVRQSDVLRIAITEDGIYRLSYEALANVGLQPQLLNPQRLHLYNQGKEVAIRVIVEEQFKPGDAIEFYAQGINNNFTNTNVYWLYWRKKGAGKRMAQIDGSVTGKGEKINAFLEHLHFEKNSRIWQETPDAPEQDYWFWKRLSAPDTEKYSLNIPSPSAELTEAIVRVGFQDYSYSTHHTIIKLNDTQIGEESWDDESIYIQEMPVSSELFNDGNNELIIRVPGDTDAKKDVIYLNWIEVKYWRTFEAVNDQLVFTVNRNGAVTVPKLSQSDILIYDITNPNAAAEVINFAVDGDKQNYQATFETAVESEKTYYISTTQQIKSPSSITLWQPTGLKSLKNGADYILITTPEFLPAVEPLCELRRKQGLRVKSVSVEDIYNEFNNGLFAPVAIKNFLQYAYEHWNRPAPTYVLLVGDANLNYKSEKTKKGNKVPVHLSQAYFSGDLFTPDDSWYVNVDGDYILPDMFIGRIPGSSSEVVAELIDKIIRFEESPRENPRKVLLVADSNAEFEDENEIIFDYLPTSFAADKIYLRDYLAGVEKKEKKKKKIAQATQDIIASINGGVMISSYIGHGTMDRWSQSKGLFKPDNVHTLSNEEQLAFVVMLTCINGYFADPNKYSLAEEFILARGGAIGTFAPSNVSYSWEDEILAHEIFSTIFAEGNRILGAITTQAKIATYGRGGSETLVQMFTLFGDPATRLKDWR